ncbi:MAG: hypothetical protein K0R76_22 [Alphaproteobacteria bacterium]|jgi:hypothetical protein|nr:hypothetical protein [Alphaproteobacteria bacterium]
MLSPIMSYLLPFNGMGAYLNYLVFQGYIRHIYPEKN